MVKNILVFEAHHDDSIVGMGGSLARFKDKNYNIKVVVLSKGHLSHPHLKEKVIIRTRSLETKKVDKLLGRETICLNLNEGKIKKEFYDKKKDLEVKKIISKFNPDKIYVLSPNDPHPDHRATSKVIMEILDNFKCKSCIYYYEVWNILEDSAPKVYIDISRHFEIKKQALREYKSQMHFILPLWLPMYFRARIYGRRINKKFAEKFYRIK